MKNNFVESEYIPKLGTKLDTDIYRKIMGFRTPIINIMQGDNVPVYLNMRAAFWIKAFIKKHAGAEYKTFECQDQSYANYCMCLLNSSLFWWYWICVSELRTVSLYDSGG